MLPERLGVFKKNFICKVKCRATKSNKYDVYNNFILELWHFTVIVEIKNEIQTSFNSLVSKKPRTWWL